ncbi:MAG: hypothetical protein ACFE85_07120 [Candidatus Hodarchaeota archaeon]
MKAYRDIKEKQDIIEEQLINISYDSYNFNEIPPVIGIIIADQYGNTITVYEYNDKEKSNYGPITSYLSNEDKNLLEIDLISMYFSSFKIFAGQTNIKNLSNLEIYGSNIKIQIYFLFEKFIIIIFLNSNTDLTPKKKKEILNHFEEILIKYEYEFENFNETKARKVINSLEIKGKIWLKKFNYRYREIYRKFYLESSGLIEKLIIEIDPIIQNELTEYLENIPEEIVKNVTIEIKNKIQDKLYHRSNII